MWHKVAFNESSPATVWATGHPQPRQHWAGHRGHTGTGGVAGGADHHFYFPFYFFVFAKYYTRNTLHLEFTKKRKSQMIF